MSSGCPRTGLPRSPVSVTGDALARLLEVCAGGHLVDIRDCALLLTVFASGRRRRLEVEDLRVEDLTDEEPVRAEPAATNSLGLPCLVTLSAAPNGGLRN